MSAIIAVFCFELCIVTSKKLVVAGSKILRPGSEMRALEHLRCCPKVVLILKRRFRACRGRSNDIGTVVPSYGSRARGHARSCNAEGRMKKLTAILVLILSMVGAAYAQQTILNLPAGS